MKNNKTINVPIIDVGDILAVFNSKVVKSGNGAVVKAYKKYLYNEAIVLIKKDLDDFEKDIVDKYELD